MLFNSYEFILFFLPLTFGVYFLCQKIDLPHIARCWLLAASLFFYGWWNIKFLPLIVVSILVNYIVGQALTKTGASGKPKGVLALGVAFNLGLLGYFKYADFFLENLNQISGASWPLLHIILPLGISFFTFTQIAYLVDAYQGKAREYNIINYGLFVTFFPHLLAGPILHHKEMMPQFSDPSRQKLNYEYIAPGLYLFFIGLAKKVFIADFFAIWANQGFDDMALLTFGEAWLTSLAYTFQLYFDFSAYTDMAIGGALLFNIKLPINFFSPYKALNIQDFWRRWHMTLGRFFRDYVYFPWGGSRKGAARTYINLLGAFFLVGLWHGAGWTFVFWGLLHGAALALHRIWKSLDVKLPVFLSWLLTFNFVNIAWVFFRAEGCDEALKVLRGMTGYNGFGWSGEFTAGMDWLVNIMQISGIGESQGNILLLFIYLLIGLLICTVCRNSIQKQEGFRPNGANAIFIVVLGIAGILSLTRITQFLYFNF